ncbi:MAG: hypothetical protein BAA01_06690 [Bacillus thermozeamaize]|uniref:DUF309 domain-containing protein n=1 Tax=Bacillus thermozeamaize TaxID=230954 RepID=A0A1Y3PGG5_9BACI|nr:MAG: hypothetical protein BAA01_06690 [Bacillus thermozeamaize]
MAKRYPDLYYRFFEQFNQGEYYACHDLLEELWMEDRSNKFLQGLLQMAVAIHHIQNGNVIGARRLFQSAQAYLQPYRPRYWDVNLEIVLQYIDECLRLLPAADKISVEEARRLSLPALVLHVEEGPDSPKTSIKQSESL